MVSPVCYGAEFQLEAVEKRVFVGRGFSRDIQRPEKEGL